MDKIICMSQVFLINLYYVSFRYEKMHIFCLCSDGSATSMAATEPGPVLKERSRSVGNPLSSDDNTLLPGAGAMKRHCTVAAGKNLSTS